MRRPDWRVVLYLAVLLAVAAALAWRIANCCCPEGT